MGTSGASDLIYKVITVLFRQLSSVWKDGANRLPFEGIIKGVTPNRVNKNVEKELNGFGRQFRKPTWGSDFGYVRFETCE